MSLNGEDLTTLPNNITPFFVIWKEFCRNLNVLSTTLHWQTGIGTRNTSFYWTKIYCLLKWNLGTETIATFLGAFAKLRKETITSTLLAVLMEQLGSHWTDFHEILYLSILRKSTEKIQVSLKCDKNNGHFTWRSMYIYDILLNSS
jgi:hypothetical protein